MRKRTVVARLFLVLVCLGQSAAAPASETITYRYDALGRLVSTASTGGGNDGLATSIAYDPAGNRQSYSVSGVPSGPPGIVADGSFENPPQNGGYTYDPTITGVGFSGNAGVASNGSDWGFTTAPDGSQEAFLQGGPAPAVISMALSGLTPGVTYSVRFSAAQRSNFYALPIAVSFTRPGGTTALGTYTPESIWFSQVQTTTFTATAATGTLTFTGTNSSAYYCAGVDAVAVVAVS